MAWKFTDGIDYTFPGSPGLTIDGGVSLIVAKDPAAFMLRYPGVNPAMVFGPYGGNLSNGGEKLELSQPGDVDDDGVRYWIRVDRVNYSDGSSSGGSPSDVDLWPDEADGEGKSLTRQVMSDYGNDPANWMAADPSPGG